MGSMLQSRSIARPAQEARVHASDLQVGRISHGDDTSSLENVELVNDIRSAHLGNDSHPGFPLDSEL